MLPRALAAVLALAWFTCRAQTPASQTRATIPSVDEAIHGLSVHRDNAKQYVQLAREIKDPSAREQAWLLYSEARAQYNAFIDDIATGIDIGGKNESEAMKHANDAYHAGATFQQYVETQRAAQSQDHMGATPLSVLLPVGKRLLDAFLGITLKPPAADTKKLNLISRVEGYKWPEWPTSNVDLSPDTPIASPGTAVQPTKPPTPDSDHQGP